MHRPQVFVKKSKKGNVVRVLKEHYLRDDISCCSALCTKCKPSDVQLSKSGLTIASLFENQPHYLLPDTNVFLHQIDVLEHPLVRDVIVLQTVLDEVRHRSPSLYSRARAIIGDSARRFVVLANEHHSGMFVERKESELPNDRNDRAIRQAGIFLRDHLASAGMSVVLLSDDRGNRELAVESGLLCASVRKYIESVSDAPDLHDRIAAAASAASADKENVLSNPYDEHMETSSASSGVAARTLVQGSFHRSTLNLNEASLWVKGNAEPVLIVGTRAMNRAVQDDQVVVKVLPRAQWRAPSQFYSSKTTSASADASDPASEPGDANAEGVVPTGVVVAILNRRPRVFCGSLAEVPRGAAKAKDPIWATFVPLDERMPRIRFLTRQAAALEGQRIVVAIDAWPAGAVCPVGHLVNRLGRIGEVETETRVVLLEKDIPHAPFTPAVLACLPGEGWIADKDPDIHNTTRRDLRHLDVCSVDPPGCTDIDDALHAVMLDNGNMQLGVHIADVTYFVKPLSAVDKEAAHRGTSTYLVDRRIDMLPPLLGTSATAKIWFAPC